MEYGNFPRQTQTVFLKIHKPLYLDKLCYKILGPEDIKPILLNLVQVFLKFQPNNDHH